MSKSEFDKNWEESLFMMSLRVTRGPKKHLITEMEYKLLRNERWNLLTEPHTWFRLDPDES